MLLKELSNAPGISGQEEAVRDLILNAITPYVSHYQVDSMGNILALLPGTAPERHPRVMLDAHMDEVGFMVTGYDSDGLLHVNSVGGIDDRILPALRVKVGELNGVFIWAPIHKNREQNVVKLASLRVDIGAKSKSEAESAAPLGTPVTFDTQFGELGRLWMGKALDDRAGCALLVDVLANGPYPCDVLAAFTVQEEVGLRGATVAARALRPDVAFSIETTTANDLPDPTADPDNLAVAANPVCKLGAGTVVTLMDGSIVVNPKLTEFIMATAAKHGLPAQYKSKRGGGNDAGAIQFQNGGIPVATLSLPARYIHSPAALIDPQDYQNTLALIQALLREVQPAHYVQV